ncbi:diiron oxygenase [Pseudomonas sp. NPDC090233]|uniref:diiron oxygenase n=1 Tax=Pseudomonas sp. NPDC090233 TaxID=3364479 RepID=UPI00383A5D1E
MGKGSSASRAEKVFESWSFASTVRARPYMYKFSDQNYLTREPGLWFPEALMPLLKHPKVGELVKERLVDIHIQHLLHFLDYTTKLEVAHVNRAVSAMIHGALFYYFSEGERCVALKLYTDEGYHALFSNEMAEQLARRFSLRRKKSGRIRQFDRIVSASPAEFKHLAAFVIAFVSETVIVEELSCLARSDLVPPVFNMFKDHLHDEAKHAVFFSECWVRLWPQLLPTEKNFVVDLLVKVISVFGRPDTRFLLSALSFDPALGRLVVADLKSTWKSGVHRVLALTIKALRRTDLLDREVYLRKFQAAGLLS